MIYLSEREGAPKFLNESNFGLPILELLIEIRFLLALRLYILLSSLPESPWVALMIF